MSAVARRALGPAPQKRIFDAATAREHALYALVPAIVTAFFAYHAVAAGILAVDFKDAYRTAALAVLHGTSPYASTSAQVAAAEAFVYPAVAAVLLVPAGLVSSTVGAALFASTCAGAAVATLYVLAVRDWRLYGLVAVLPWVVAGWQTANLTLLLGLGLALVWRHRQRPALAGALSALLISLKPFIWPLALWLVATRRWRAAAWCVASGAAMNAAAWGVLGTRELARYVHLSSVVTGALYRTGYGVIALAVHLGASRGAGTVLEVLVSVALALACVVAARRRDEARALTWAVLLMLAASPLVWSHYFALLIVPLALVHPRLHPTWLVPLLMWCCTVRTADGWQTVLAWLVVGYIALDLLRPPAPRTVIPA